MMLTEQKARGKWCPMGFAHKFQAHSGAEGYVANIKNGRPMCNCIGSGCMMWRFSSKPLPKSVKHKMTAEEFRDFWEKELPTPERPENVPAEWGFFVEEDGCFWVEDEAGRVERRKGYCSFAGVPGVAHEE